MKIQKIHIIINPASGRLEPILPVINLAFKDSGIDWGISITKKSGDCTRFAKEYVDKVDAIGVYGGDGTVMEAINGVIDTSTPLAVLPGGTANVMAVELGIPTNLKQACELLAQGAAQVRKIDVCKFGKRHFILRAGMGFEAEMVRKANREIKNKWGRLAYVIAAFEAAKKVKLVNYEITVDGETRSVKGLDCIIANAGSVGFGDLTLDRKIDVSDGLMDLIVLKKWDWSLARYVYRILSKKNPSDDWELVGHWRGKDIKIEAKPAQNIISDGENLGKVELHAKILPEAVGVLVPPSDKDKK